MEEVDLNLLGALDALLAEGSVTGAARRLSLSTSAMSRTLGRLRSATCDPMLVWAGRGRWFRETVITACRAALASASSAPPPNTGSAA